MHEVWLFLKRTFHCKPHQEEVHDPKASRYQRSTHRTKSCELDRSNIQGSKKHSEKQLSLNPKPKGGIDITHTITHEIVLDSSNSDIKVCPCCPCPQSNSSNKGSKGSRRTTRPRIPSRTNHHVDYNEGNIFSNTRMLVQIDSDGPSAMICPKCGEKLKHLDAVEAHNISKHSVAELQEDSSRQIIQTICGTSSVNSENISGMIDCILKVQNMPKTLAFFEEYREMVKTKADKLEKKHPRCLADGNELLRFHGTTIACSLGINSCYSLCTLDHCGVCQILRHGFSTNKEFQGAFGVYTTSTSGKAFDSIRPSIQRPLSRKSVIVCRAIAGVVFSPFGEIQEKVGSVSDSLAEKISGHSDIEELYVLDPKALLPCFVVIYKQHTMKVRRLNPSFRNSF